MTNPKIKEAIERIKNRIIADLDFSINDYKKGGNKTWWEDLEEDKQALTFAIQTLKRIDVEKIADIIDRDCLTRKQCEVIAQLIVFYLEGE